MFKWLLLLLGIVVLALAGNAARYDIRTTTSPGIIYRLDRFTGRIDLCQVGPAPTPTGAIRTRLRELYPNAYAMPLLRCP